MKRYDLVQVNACYTTDHQMEPSDDGEWVRFEDLSDVLPSVIHAEERPTLEHAARLLAKSVPDIVLESVRAVWGNTNVAVIKHWRDIVLAHAPAEERETPVQRLKDLQRANALVDDAVDPQEYQTRLIAMGLIARQYLRDLAALPAADLAVTAPDVRGAERFARDEVAAGGTVSVGGLVCSLDTDPPPQCKMCGREGGQHPPECPRAVTAPQAQRFPIQDGPSIPWSAIAPHDRQAQRNHGRQTLERLAERGGLSPSEAVAVLEDRDWHPMDRAAAKTRMVELCEPFEAVQQRFQALTHAIEALRGELLAEAEETAETSRAYDRAQAFLECSTRLTAILTAWESGHI